MLFRFKSIGLISVIQVWVYIMSVLLFMYFFSCTNGIAEVSIFDLVG